MLDLFRFEGKELRFVGTYDKPEWIAKDVCNCLEIKNVSDALADLEPQDKGIVLSDTPSGKQQMLTVFESGLYALTFKSRKEEAKRFKRWMFEEVLPQIRKTGSYSVSQIKTPQNYLEALKALVASEEQKELLRLENEQLEKDNEVLATAVDELFNYSSILRVAKFNKISEKTFSYHRLKAVSKQMGLEVKKVPSPRYANGMNLYPHDAWRVAYPDVALPETTTLRIYTHQSIK